MENTRSIIVQGRDNDQARTNYCVDGNHSPDKMPLLVISPAKQMRNNSQKENPPGVIDESGDIFLGYNWIRSLYVPPTDFPRGGYE
jgi:hypothetical protein